MAKLVKPLAFRATCFVDGPKSTYFQEWQCQKYPSLFIRVVGKKGGDSVKTVFVKKQNLNVLEFDSVESALPTARKDNWNPYERSAPKNSSRKDRSDQGVLVLGRGKEREADHDISPDVKDRREKKTSRNLAVRKRKRRNTER